MGRHRSRTARHWPERCRDGRVATRDERDEPPLENPPLDEDMPPAALAPQADVRTEAVDQPVGRATRVTTAQSDDVAEEDLERRTGRVSIGHSAGQGIRAVVGHDWA